MPFSQDDGAMTQQKDMARMPASPEILLLGPRGRCGVDRKPRPVILEDSM
ncbi:MAG: hypothetical protein JWN69_1579 [Alphaproteobacteria bacterium]|nr:hypothetical protein [Alphaproteobacteria bacterium]